MASSKWRSTSDCHFGVRVEVKMTSESGITKTRSFPDAIWGRGNGVAKWRHRNDIASDAIWERDIGVAKRRTTYHLAK